MKMLRARLYQIALEEQTRKKQADKATQKKITFGAQVRNYVLSPYTLVKDLRSGYETSNVNKLVNHHSFIFARVLWFFG